MTESYSSKGTPAYKKAATALQDKLGEIGCLKTSASDYNDGGWGNGSKTGFHEFKTKLEADFPTIKYKTTDDLATVEGYLDNYAKADWKAGHAACASVKAGPVFGKCDLPKLRQAWMTRTDKDKKTVDDGILAFYQSLPNVENYSDSYFPPETDYIKAAVALGPKGKTYDPDDIYGQVADLLPAVKRHLNAAAVGNDYSCQRCILLNAYKALLEKAQSSNGILLDTSASNNHLYITAVSFDMLKAEIQNIQDWASFRAAGSNSTAKGLLNKILKGFRGLTRAKASDTNQPHSVYAASYAAYCEDFVLEIKK